MVEQMRIAKCWKLINDWSILMRKTTVQLVSTIIHQFRFPFSQVVCYTERFPYMLWKDVLPSTFLWAEGLVNLLNIRDMNFKCRISVIALLFKHKKATTKPLCKTKQSSEISHCVHTKIPLKEPSSMPVQVKYINGLYKNKTIEYCHVKYEKT